MANYILIEKDSGKIVKRARRLPTIDGSIPADLDPSLVWLEVTEDAKPEHDSTTHRLKQSQARDGDVWRISWTITELSAGAKAKRVTSEHEALRGEGFMYADHNFSFDKIPIYNGTYIARTALTYPVEALATDGRVLDLANADQVAAFYLTGLALYQAISTAEAAALKAIQPTEGE